MITTTYLKQDHSVHTYNHISQQLDSLANTEQQCKVFISKVDASLFTSNTSTQCAFNIVPTNTEMETEKSMEETPQNNTGIHFHSKHKYRDTFGDAHIKYRDFDNGDAFTYKDKYKLHCYSKSYKIPIGVYMTL